MSKAKESANPDRGRPTEHWFKARMPVGQRTEFEEKYPPDREPGTELGDSARVWKVYRGEAIEHDDALLKSWNDTVNILLTFAGLFSAAVTSFVIVTAADLKPDPNAYIANVLDALLNSSGADNSTLALFQPLPPLVAAPTDLSRVVNGLWFVSLFLALTAALLCILVKQWLDQYMSRTRSSSKHTRQWAQRRAFYFQGLNDWNIGAIISFLPLFLHLALFFFLAGLTGFLWTLDRVIARVMLALVGALVAFYMGCFILPLWSAACPYATPLLHQLLGLPHSTGVGALKLNAFLQLSTMYVRSLKWGPPRGDELPVSLPLLRLHRDADAASIASDRIAELQRGLDRFRHRRARRPFDRSLEEKQQRLSFVEAESECNALSWLIHEVSDTEALAVAWQSLAAFPAEPHYIWSEKQRLLAMFIRAYHASGGIAGAFNSMQSNSAEALDDTYLTRINRSLVCCLVASREARSPPWWGASEGDRSRMWQWMARASASRSPSRDWAICLLLLSNPETLPDGVLSHVARCLSCSHRHEQRTARQVCLINCLALRFLQLEEEESKPNFDSFRQLYHKRELVILMMDIMGYLPKYASSEDCRHSSGVWYSFTTFFDVDISGVDAVHLSRGIQALRRLVQNSHDVPNNVAHICSYLTAWRRLLSGPAATHAVLPHVDTDLTSFAVDLPMNSAQELLSCWDSLMRAILDLRERDLRLPAFRSLLALFDTLVIAVGNNRPYPDKFENFIHVCFRLLVAACLASPEDERDSWTKLFARTMQHLIALNPNFWTMLKQLAGEIEAVAKPVVPTVGIDRSTIVCSYPIPPGLQDRDADPRDETEGISEEDVKTFFAQIKVMLKEMGPCQEGSCVGREVNDWPEELQ